MTTGLSVSTVGLLLLMLISIIQVTENKKQKDSKTQLKDPEIDNHGCYDIDQPCDSTKRINANFQNDQCHAECIVDGYFTGECNYEKERCCCIVEDINSHSSRSSWPTSQSGTHRPKSQLSSSSGKQPRESSLGMANVFLNSEPPSRRSSVASRPSSVASRQSSVAPKSSRRTKYFDASSQVGTLVEVSRRPSSQAKTHRPMSQASSSSVGHSRESSSGLENQDTNSDSLSRASSQSSVPSTSSRRSKKSTKVGTLVTDYEDKAKKSREPSESSSNPSGRSSLLSSASSRRRVNSLVNKYGGGKRKPSDSSSRSSTTDNSRQSSISSTSSQRDKDNRRKS